MDGQKTHSADEIYKWAMSNSDNRLQFIITTHYNQVLARAQDAGLVRGDVGYMALTEAVKSASVNPQLYAQVLNITPDTSNMSPEAAEAWNQLISPVVNRPLALNRLQTQSLPYYCQPGFQGPIPPNAAPCPSASSGGGSSWFNSETVGTVLENLPEIGTAISCWIDPTRCQPQQPPVVVTPSTQQSDNKTNYMPWIIGGGVLLAFIAVILVVVLRTK